MKTFLSRAIVAILALSSSLAFGQGTTVSSMPAASSPLGGSEPMLGVQGGHNAKITPAQISSYALTSPTTTGKLTTAASATGSAGFRLPHGAAPTSPANGDLWTTTSGLYAFVNGSIIGPFGAGSSGTVTSVALSVPSFLSIAGSPVTTSGTLAISLSGTALPVANGGTGAVSLTANNVLLGNGTSAVAVVAPGTSGNVLTSNGTTWQSTTLPTGGTVTHTAGALTANQVLLGAGGADTVALGSAGTTTTVLHGNVAGVPSFSAVSLATDVSGTLPVTSGGTGATSLTANAILLGTGTTAIAPMGSLGTTTTLLHGNPSGAPTFAAASLTTDVSGLLPVANGGTGTATPGLVAGSNVTVTGSWPNQTVAATSPGTGTVTHTAGALTANQLVIGAGAADTAALGSLGTTTTVLHGNASGSPTFGAVALATDVSGTLPVASGGTGTSSPGIVAGTNVTSVTGTWPNQTINAATQTFTGGTLTSALNEAPTVTIASSATPAIGAAAGNTILITGTTTITGFDTIGAGAVRRVRFSGALTLTYNATSLILPSSANITTAADDTAEFLSLGSGNWFCLRYNRSSGSALVSSGGGGLTNFTESVNTSSPNATIPATRLLATNAATNVDIALSPKGTGALLAAVPDSTATGGNKRGTNAVDWQSARGSATQVASGTGATVAGGQNNTASATYDAVGGGSGNIASGGRSTVPGGIGNTAGGLYSAAIGNSNTVNGQGSFAAGETNTVSGVDAWSMGAFNLADAQYSSATGAQATTRTMIGAAARANGSRSSQGDNQTRMAVLRAQTSSATGVVATSDAGAAGTANQFVCPNGGSLKFRAQVVLRNTSSGDTGYFDVTGAVKRVANVLTLAGTPTVSAYAGDSSLNTATVTVSADNTNKAVQITVAGLASTTINWTVDVQTVELQ